jgi:hypothetical protein
MGEAESHLALDPDAQRFHELLDADPFDIVALFAFESMMTAALDVDPLLNGKLAPVIIHAFDEDSGRFIGIAYQVIESEFELLYVVESPHFVQSTYMITM